VQDVDELRSLVVGIGGRPVEDGWDRLARYCGLEWSGGSNETWAFRYYDSVWSPPDDTVKPVDVLATAALHPGLSRSDLTFFHDEQPAISGWLEDLPTDRGLAGVDGAVLRHLADLASWEIPVSMQLLTKVLHRKRPLLIPLIDRHVLDWYRPITGERSAAKAWPALLRAMRDDLDFGNAVSLDSMAAGIEERTLKRLSPLRIIDVIVWMGAHS
jgi:hypothetical protein